VIRWLLLTATVLYIITGFGITEFRVVESVTFGLLTKPLAFRIHEFLWIPFFVLLAVHIFWYPLKKLFRSARKSSS
jgi:cytochrome b subunit of formate dehydrogenase